MFFRVSELGLWFNSCEHPSEDSCAYGEQTFAAVGTANATCKVLQGIVCFGKTTHNGSVHIAYLCPWRFRRFHPLEKCTSFFVWDDVIFKGYTASVFLNK